MQSVVPDALERALLEDKPDIMVHRPDLPFIGMHDPTDCIQGSNDQPYAYMAVQVWRGPWDADMHKIIIDNRNDRESVAGQHEPPTCSSHRSAVTEEDNEAHSTTATIGRNLLDLSEILAMKSCLSLSHRSDDRAKQAAPSRTAQPKREPKCELQASWKDQDISNIASFEEILKKEPARDIYQLRATFLLYERVTEQLLRLEDSGECVQKSWEGEQ